MAKHIYIPPLTLALHQDLTSLPSFATRQAGSSFRAEEHKELRPAKEPMSLERLYTGCTQVSQETEGLHGATSDILHQSGQERGQLRNTSPQRYSCYVRSTGRSICCLRCFHRLGGVQLQGPGISSYMPLFRRFYSEDLPAHLKTGASCSTV